MTSTERHLSPDEKARRAAADLAKQIRSGYRDADVVAAWPEDEGQYESIQAAMDSAGNRLDGLDPDEDEYALADLTEPASTQLSLLMHLGSDEPEHSDFPGQMVLRLPAAADSRADRCGHVSSREDADDDPKQPESGTAR